MSMRIEQSRSGLATRLRARLPEIEQAALTRVYSVSDSTETADPEYSEGLRTAVAAALQYGIRAAECSEEQPPLVPEALLAQARLAATHGVRLETVLRRYVAGYTLLGDFLIEESENAPFEGAALKGLLRVQAVMLDHLIGAVSEEYARARAASPGSAEQRRAERVKRLLAGERLDTSDLAYDFDAHHIGAVVAGLENAEAMRDFAKAHDCRLLLVRRREGALWVWLGARRRMVPEELADRLLETWPAQISLALGEPAQGIAGWRLTHQQASAAMPIALRSRRAVVRYADVALLASVLQDDVLVASLYQLYLSPLSTERDGGRALRETLRAYFAAERNVSSAAAAIGVNRQTVVNRLTAIEERFERPLSSCAAEVETALLLEELDHSVFPHFASART
jgi:PucR-like helix-turn-helix protein/diguanylate cyclase with GGDEF domain